MATKKQKTDDMQRVIANIEKSLGNKGDPVISKYGDREHEKVPSISFGLPNVDKASNCGGVPQGKLIEIFGPESGGKSYLCYKLIGSAQQMGRKCCLIDAEQCLAEGTLVYNYDLHKYISVEDLYKSGKTFGVLSHNSCGELVRQDALAKQSNVRQTFAIKVKYGREINLTSNHKVLTNEGYVLVSNLKVGDIMYIPSIIPDIENNNLSDFESYKYRLLGYHLGDGTHGKPIISNIDIDIINDLNTIAGNFNCTTNINKTNIRMSGVDRNEYSIPKSELCSLIDDGYYMKDVAELYGCSVDTIKSRMLEYGMNKDMRSRANVLKSNKQNTQLMQVKPQNRLRNKINNAEIWLSQFDCFYKKSKDRSMPNQLNKQQLAHVIAGLFMTDGTAVDYNKQKKCLLSFSTSSKRLAMDIEASLTRFGIFSSIYYDQKKRKCGSAYDKNYKVAVSGKDNISLFIQLFPIFGYKKDRLVHAINSVSSLSHTKCNSYGLLIEAPVVSIEKSNVVATYDVSVNNKNYVEQNFLAEGLFIHNSFDPIWAERQGVDTDNLYLIDEGISAEVILDYVAEICGSGAFGLVVVDSTAALIPEKELEGSVSDQDYALLARAMSKGCKKIMSACGNNNVTCAFVNQIREKMGVRFGSNETTPGGRALKFYAHQRIRVVPGATLKAQIEGEEVIVGRLSYVNFVKNKTAVPFGKCEMNIMFDESANNPVFKLVNLARENQLVTIRNGIYSLHKDAMGTTKNVPTGCKSLKDVADFLVKNKLVSRVLAELIDYANDDSTISIDSDVIELGTLDPKDIDSPVNPEDSTAIELGTLDPKNSDAEKDVEKDA